MTEFVISQNPATGETLAKLPATPIPEVHAAIARAREALPAWKATSVEDRCALFERLAQLMDEQADALMDLICEESGKIRGDAEYEVVDIIDGVAHFNRQMRLLAYGYHDVPQDFLPRGTRYNTLSELRYEPHGVVSVIMPWNFPFWIPMTNLIPAMLAGNTAVFKPSEYTPLIGNRIVELFQQAGFPKDVLQIVHGADEVGKAMVAGDVDLILFTGGLQAARHIKNHAGMKAVWVESGGNTGSVVCADADVETAVAGTVWGGTYHAGQSCSSHKRVYVHKDVADEFIAGVKAKIESLRPLEHFGPYIRHEAMWSVHTQVQDGVARGATLLTGGEPIADMPAPYTNGYWYPPTALVFEDDSLPVVAEEVFGNVLTIRVVNSDEEGIAKVNDTNYGLTAIVWTGDLDRGRRIADQLDAGMAFVNDADIFLVAGEYWGGWHDSGIGTTGTKLEKCMKQKLVITHTHPGPRDYWF